MDISRAIDMANTFSTQALDIKSLIIGVIVAGGGVTGVSQIMPGNGVPMQEFIAYKEQNAAVISAHDKEIDLLKQRMEGEKSLADTIQKQNSEDHKSIKDAINNLTAEVRMMRGGQ